MRWLMSRGRPVSDETGQVVRYIGICIDITELKQVEEALRESEQRHLSLIEHLPQRIFIKDRNCVYLSCNANYAADLGITPEQIVGKDDFAFHTPELAQLYRADDKACMATGMVKDLEESYQLHGQERWAHTIKLPYRDGQGRVIGVLGIFEDITEQKLAAEALKRERDQAQNYLDVAAVMIAALNAEGNITMINKKGCDILGYRENDILGQNWFDVCLPAELRQEVKGVFDLLMTGDIAPVEYYENPVLTGNGEQRIMAFHNTVLYDSPYRIVGILFSGEDITDRKRSQEALRASESFLNSVIEQSPYSMWISDHQGTLIRANKALRDLFQMSDEEIVGKYNIFNDNIVEEQGFMPLIKSVFERGDTARFELKYDTSRLENVLLRHSTFVILEVTVFPIMDSDNKITNAVIQHMDITDRKRAEEALRESEERLRLLIESAPIAIRIATQGRYYYVNPAFLNLFGYGCAEEIEGLPVEALYVEQDKRLIIERNANRAQGLSVDPHYRVTGIRKDGTHVDLEAWGSEISYQGQRSTLRFLIDVTEANSLRAQLLQAQKMEAVGTLAGGIAHDFNNLLQAVLGYSDFMLQRKKEGEPDYADLQKIYKAGKRGADLVKSLMTFSQKVETKYSPVNLNQEITQVQELLSRTIPKTVRIDLHLNGDLESINADRSQIGQILMNLGVNARDAMPDGGTLTIETTNVQLDQEYCSDHLEAIPGSYVLLTVSDTGEGMDRKILSHIFEPFFSTKEVGKGTGLGLATVYGIVKQHGGRITCYSEPGHGTTFKIYLPAIQIKKDLETRTFEAAIPGGTETILLVDDDNDIRDLGATLLNEFGYKVITAGNGKEALDIYQREGESISLIILDLIMPEMDGKQCMAEILRVNPSAKVIIASGYSEYGPADGVMAAGAQGFVQKPYNMRQFLTTIRDILDKDR